MKRIFVLSAVLLFQTSLHAMTLGEYLDIVSKRHRSILSLEAQKEASDFKREAGDIDLVPVLQGGYGYLRDKSPSNQFVSFGADESKITDYTLSLAKKFSSGTSIKLFAQAQEFENPGIGSVPLFATLEEYSVGSLGVAASQSLWKDFFGYGTRLRRESESFENKSEKANADLNIRGLLAKAEGDFWEYIYWSENRIIAKGSLDRSKKIESWMKRRTSDGISDRADLYEVQGLVASRQLAVIAADDAWAAARRRVRDNLELAESDPMPELQGDLSAPRSLMAMIGSNKGKIVALEAYAAAMSAKRYEAIAKKVDDDLKPDLVLSGSYNTNSMEDSLTAATREWGDTNRPTMKIGVNFVYPIDTDVKQAARNQAKSGALAAKLQSERAMLESDSAWIELNRQYSDMNARIEAASNLLKIQTSRSKAQVDKFNKGRSITSDVVNSEEDVANSELNVARLKTEQRKMEAQARLFITVEE